MSFPSSQIKSCLENIWEPPRSITPTIGMLLEKMYFNITQFEDFYNSLSIAGVDGTLEKRMRKTSAENNFRGKTGTLNGVSSISGYVTNTNGDDIIVCMMFEFKKGGARKYRDLQDRIIEVLADWKNESPDIDSSGLQ